MNRFAVLVLVLVVVAAIAYAQGGMPPENPGMPFGGDPMGPPQFMAPGMPRMGQGMMFGSPLMQISGGNVYILRGDQLIKLSEDLKVIKQVVLPRPPAPVNRPAPNNPGQN